MGKDQHLNEIYAESSKLHYFPSFPAFCSSHKLLIHNLQVNNLNLRLFKGTGGTEWRQQRSFWKFPYKPALDFQRTPFLKEFLVTLQMLKRNVKFIPDFCSVAKSIKKGVVGRNCSAINFLCFIKLRNEIFLQFFY